jgi:hypothetical protein
MSLGGPGNSGLRNPHRYILARRIRTLLVVQSPDIRSLALHSSYRDFVARHLRDGRRLRLNGHLAVTLRNIARSVALTQHGGQRARRSERHAFLMAAIGGARRT